MFFQLEWQETATGTSTTDTVLFRQGTASIVTPALLELPTLDIDNVPLGNLRVIWTHPLARNLVTCYVPGVMGGKDLAAFAGALDLNINVSTSSIFDTFGGPALQNTESGSILGPVSPVIPSSHPLRNFTQLTMFWDGCCLNSAQPLNHDNAISINYDNTGASPYIVFSLVTNAASPLELNVQWNTAGVLANGPNSPAPNNYFAPFNMAGSAVVGGNVLSYFNGLLFGTTAFGASAPTSTATTNISVNAYYTASCAFNTRVAAIWNRALSADEINWLSHHPFCFLKDGQ